MRSGRTSTNTRGSASQEKSHRSGSSSAIHRGPRESTSDSQWSDRDFADWRHVAPIPKRERKWSEQGRKHPSKVKQRVIIGIDGEGYTDEDGVHHYSLLAASNGEYVEGESLSTEQCLEFLLGLRRVKETPYLFVMFSFNYDVNMMLRDLDDAHLKQLAGPDEVTKWNGYRISYKPSRMLTIWHRRTKRHILIYDVFGFFQTSFVKALKEWNVGTQEQRERIAAMKEQRSEFVNVSREQIRTYCFDECALLVDVVRQLIDATLAAEIPCSKWYGAGALAAAMMGKNKIKRHIQIPPTEVVDASLFAYFGGRFEIRCSGEVGKVHGYDIKSAYPSVARSLPCLAHTRYERVTKYRPNITAVWHVMWNTPTDLWTPFPWRDKSRGIFYPSNGEGWYWSREVDAAVRIFGKRIRIIEGFVLQTECDDKPFSFINDVYAIRAQYQRAGNFAHKPLKLGLNSLYGKTAQSIGNPKKRPPFQSYVWAGMITSGCRAQILDAIAMDDEAVVSIATDGIISLRPLPLDIGSALGQWEHSEYDECFLVQTGIYRLRNATTTVEHTRGFGSKETDFDSIIRDFNRNPLGSHRYSATRFVGLRSALARTEYRDYWRKWVTQERRINFYPTGRFLLSDELLDHPIIHVPPTLGRITMSSQYVPKMSWTDENADIELLLDMDSE